MQKAQTYFEGSWHEGDFKIFGVEEYASWLGLSVFDGARVFDGMFPDGDLHCQRSLRSAAVLDLKTDLTWEEIHKLCVEGIHRFAPGVDLYIRIEFWDRSKYAHAHRGGNETSGQAPPAGFAVIIEDLPLTRNGTTANLSNFRRCNTMQAPTNAKASCLYPNGIMAARQANKEGFQDCVMCGPDGLVAEFTMSNLFFVTNGRIVTPRPNGTFLNGITRQRFIKLFRENGWDVIDSCDVYPAELIHADEIFSTGNAYKIQPVLKYLDRELGRGAVADIGWELYLDYAKKFKI